MSTYRQISRCEMFLGVALLTATTSLVHALADDISDKLLGSIGTTSSPQTQVVLLGADNFIDRWSPFDDNSTETLRSIFDHTIPSVVPQNCLSRVYSNAIFCSVLCTTALHATERLELDQLKHDLYADPENQVPKEGYRNYLELKKRYDDLLRKYNAASEPDKSEIRNDLNEAKEAYNLQGKPMEYQPKEARVNMLLAFDPSVWLTNLRTRFSQSYPSIEPSLKEMVFSSAWTTLTVEFVLSKDLLWVMKERNPHSRTTTLPTKSTRIVISLEVSHIEIERPWLDFSIFENKCWKLANTNPSSISSGTLDPPSGTFPAYCKGVILVRNLQITGNFPPEELSVLRKSLRMGSSIMLGSISVSGVSLMDTNETAVCRPLTNGFLSEDIQLFAAIFEALPKSPDPDPDYLWP